MLEGLDRVDWPSLLHAYGSADDVPALLRAVARDDERTRGALDALFGNIWHQGTVFEATAYAVPFVAELAAAPLSPDVRSALVLLLTCIATGRSYLDVHRSDSRWRDSTSTSAALENELKIVATARRAVEAAAPEMLHATASADDAHLRGAVIGLVAVIPHASRDVLEVLAGARDQLSELGRLGLDVAFLALNDEPIGPDALDELAKSDPELADYIADRGDASFKATDVEFLEVLCERLAVRGA